MNLECILTTVTQPIFAGLSGARASSGKKMQCIQNTIIQICKWEIQVTAVVIFINFIEVVYVHYQAYIFWKGLEVIHFFKKVPDLYYISFIDFLETRISGLNSHDEHGVYMSDLKIYHFLFQVTRHYFFNQCFLQITFSRSKCRDISKKLNWSSVSKVEPNIYSENGFWFSSLNQPFEDKKFSETMILAVRKAHEAKNKVDRANWNLSWINDRHSWLFDVAWKCSSETCPNCICNRRNVLEKKWKISKTSCR